MTAPDTCKVNGGIFLIVFFFYVLYSTLLHMRPSDSTVTEDAGIEPRTVATSALPSARSHPHPCTLVKFPLILKSALHLLLPCPDGEETGAMQ
jgi:hypothetical protein